MAFSRCVGMGVVATLGPPTESEPPTQGAARGEAERRAGAQRGPPAVALTAVRSPQAPRPAGWPSCQRKASRKMSTTLMRTRSASTANTTTRWAPGGRLHRSTARRTLPAVVARPRGCGSLAIAAGRLAPGCWALAASVWAGVGGPRKRPQRGGAGGSSGGPSRGFLTRARPATWCGGPPASPPACALATSRSGGAERVARTGWAARLGQGCWRRCFAHKIPILGFLPQLARRTGDQGGLRRGCLGLFS